MKTVSALIRRYIFSAFAIVLSLFVLNAALLIATLVGAANRRDTPLLSGYGLGDLAALAESMALDETGRVAPPASFAPDALQAEWLMQLSDSGEVLWQYALPDALNHPYTVSQVAVFAKWYLHDYPVFVFTNDFGLLVCGMPQGSFVRYNWFQDMTTLHALLGFIGPMLLADAALLLLACMLMGWRASRGLRAVAQGLSDLAEGKPVCLPERGMAAELAARLNRTSALLEQQNALIRRRDDARTRWISGVSHDIRTPLSLIFLTAEQLSGDAFLSPDARENARAIAAQGEKIRDLIDDLNLTSKLEYDAQPLRLKTAAAGALIRRCAADFCNSPQSARCSLAPDISPTAERLSVTVDEALIHRVFDNLLSNSARHNANGCTISIRADTDAAGRLRVTVRDDGCGYPDAVLAALSADAAHSAEDCAPHILGLYLVRRIVLAHGGEVRFANHGGAVCEITL